MPTEEQDSQLLRLSLSAEVAKALSLIAKRPLHGRSWTLTRRELTGRLIAAALQQDVEPTRGAHDNLLGVLNTLRRTIAPASERDANWPSPASRRRQRPQRSFGEETVHIRALVPSSVARDLEVRSRQSGLSQSRYLRRFLEAALLLYLQGELTVDPNDPWPNPK